MKCPDCQNELPEGSKFCKECGRRVELVCLECGKEIPSDSKYCLECGHDLRTLRTAPRLDYDQPHSYTPKHLADKILTGRSSIEGERKLVTILFADVAGSTAMFEKLDPEVVHQVMDGCFRLLMDDIHRYEGTVNQFRGDGLMALFGAPISHEDHAQRACHAALAIQKSLGPYAERFKREYGAEFKMRIGLNSGPVVVGTIGDDLRMDYTAQGDTSNLASRMETSAEPGSVLVSDHTYRLAREFFEFHPMGKVQVKGKQEPVEAYRLVRPTEVETRIAASAARGLTRFVGRKREIRTLKEAFAKAQSGEGQVVGIVGEAGVGKSRLLLEFRNFLPKGEHSYYEGRCLHYGGSMPYLPVLDVLRTFIGVKEGAQEEVIKEKLRERILGLDQNLQNIIPPIQELMSLKVDDDDFAKLEPQQKREKTFEAIRDLLIRGSQDRPLVVAVEDLHWVDKTTEEFLGYMIGWLPRTRILLLLLYRPEYTHQWGSKSYYSMVGVGQLSAGASAELVRAVLEGGQVVPDLKELILGRASGNPLFMEELTHTLLENGSIQRKGDRFVLAQDLSTIEVPDTIHGIISARIDRLEQHLKRIMQVASVIGREFAFRILEMITGMQDELKSALVSLQGLEFIYEKSLFPELEYIFRHALVQEVAYSSLLINRRREIHEKIGNAIESLHPQRLEEFSEMLAYHYSRSGNLAKAYEYLKRSANKALRNDATFEAVRLYKEATDVLSRLPLTDENKREQIDLVLSMQMTVRRTGYSEDFLAMLQKAEAFADELGDDKKRVRVHSTMGHYYILKCSDPQLGWKYLESCVEHPDVIEDADLMVSTGHDLCVSCMISGDWQRVKRVAPAIVNLIERDGTQAQSFGKPYNAYSYVLAMLGLSTGGCGDFNRAQQLLEDARAFALGLDHMSTTGLVEYVYGVTLAMKGAGQGAAEHFRNAIKHLEESQTVLFLGVAWAWLGYAHLLLGESQKAVDLTEKGLKMHADIGMPFWRSVCHWFCSQAHFEIGNMEEARKQGELAVQLSQANNEGHVHGHSSTWLWRVIAQADETQFNAAEQHILQGISRLEELGLPAFYGLSYFWLGELQSVWGRQEDALNHLQKAEGIFQEIGMEYWPGKTQALLAGLQPQVPAR